MSAKDDYAALRISLRDALSPFWRSNPCVGDDEIVDAVKRAVAEALADPLALMEWLHGPTNGDEVTVRRFHVDGSNTIVGLRRSDSGVLTWWGGHFGADGRVVQAIHSRAEALALLAAEGVHESA